MLVDWYWLRGAGAFGQQMTREEQNSQDYQCASYEK